MSELETYQQSSVDLSLEREFDTCLTSFHLDHLLSKIIRKHQLKSIDIVFSRQLWVEVKNYKSFVTNLTNLMLSIDQLYNKMNMVKKIEAVIAPTEPLLLYFKVCEFELSENFLWDVEEISNLSKLCLDEIFDNIEEQNNLSVVLKNYYFSNGEHTFSNIGIQFTPPVHRKTLSA